MGGGVLSGLRLGVDLGGTKTAIAVLDQSGREVLKLSAPTPRGDYDSALAALAALILDAERRAGTACSVGIGMPGAVSRRSGLVKNAYNTVFNGRPLRSDLERLLGREVRIANDANCFALSEAVDGAARGAGVVFGVILGTGVGGGIVSGGRILEGCNAIAGEWGHVPLPWMSTGEYPGPPCYCGRAGCIEQFVSGPALARDYAAASGVALEPTAIASGAARGDARCTEALRRYEDRLARALALIVNVLDPDVIVLGGGLSNVEPLYDGVPRALPRYVYSDTVETRIVRAEHGATSGVRGAAMLWP
ncbi:MAG TPA: ROK family protein [Burkholderiales bacterium]|nr:ROK family protein [Burkholderiales bacterium]